MYDKDIQNELGSADLSVGTRKTEGEIHKIVVDRQACIGAQSCVVVAGKVFQVDDQNLAYVTGDLDSTDEETIKLAAQSCPVLAIHLYRKDGSKIFPDTPAERDSE